MIEIYESYSEVQKPKSKGDEQVLIRKEKFLGRGKFSILNGLKYAKQGVYMLLLQDNK